MNVQTILDIGQGAVYQVLDRGRLHEVRGWSGYYLNRRVWWRFLRLSGIGGIGEVLLTLGACVAALTPGFHLDFFMAPGAGLFERLHQLPPFSEASSCSSPGCESGRTAVTSVPTPGSLWIEHSPSTASA